jgi:hypothetical protein
MFMSTLLRNTNKLNRAKISEKPGWQAKIMFLERRYLHKVLHTILLIRITI